MCWRIRRACLPRGAGAPAPRRARAGQATVEAAFCLPVLFCLLLLLLQPGIVLYDRIVMEGAAAEGCRLLATRSAQEGPTDEECRQLVCRHLGAIPQHDLFHVHEGGCYQVELSGGQGGQATVRITNRIRLLPLVDAACGAAGAASGGQMAIVVERACQTQPDWMG